MHCQFVTTVLSPDDIAAISQIVATTIHGLQAGRDGGGGNREKCHVDEKFFRKIPTFAGENWSDWSFQVKAAAKSSSKEAGKLLDWAEEQLDEILEYSAFVEDANRAEQMSGELFQILTQLAAGEPLQVLHNCAYNGIEAQRRLVKRFAPSTPLRAMQLLLGDLEPREAKEQQGDPEHDRSLGAPCHGLGAGFEGEHQQAACGPRSSDIRDSLLPDEGAHHRRGGGQARAGGGDRSCPDGLRGELEDQQTTAASTQQAAADKGPCYRCGENGHFARDCSKGANDVEGQG